MSTINNLYIDQGSTFSAVIQVYDQDGAPFNLAGFTAESQIRKNYATNTIAANILAQVLSAANGTINLSMTRGETANLKYGRYVYDVEITSGSNTLRAAEGIVVVYPNVTR